MSDALLLDRIRALTAPLAPEPTGIAPELGPLTGVRAVLFDVYGTLLAAASGDIGTTAAQAPGDAAAAALAAAGLGGALDAAAVPQRLHQAIEARHERARRLGIAWPEVDIREVWAELLAEQGQPVAPACIRRLALEYELRINCTWPMPGLAATLAALKQRGRLLGIVSNAQFYTPLLLDVFLGGPPGAAGLDPAYSAWSYRIGRAKPGRTLFRTALGGLRRHHGIAPEEVLYVGNDRRNDIWPAGRLGLRTALFAGDARSLRLHESDPRLAGVAPTRTITALDQLLQLVD